MRHFRSDGIHKLGRWPGGVGQRVGVWPGVTALPLPTVRASSYNMATVWHVMPIDLVRLVLEHAARDGLDDDPRFAFELQLISTEIRQLLLPIVYHTFNVKTPPFFCREGDDDDGYYSPDPDTPSMSFFLEMIANPAATPRQHIRHIGFEGSGLYHYRNLFSRALMAIIVAHERSWEVDSIAIGVSLSRFRFALLVLAPRGVFEAGKSRFSLPTGIVSAGLVNCRSGADKTPKEPVVRTLRIRLVQSYFDRGFEIIVQTIRAALDSTSALNYTDIGYKIPAASLIVQIEANAAETGSGLLENITAILPLLLELAALYHVNITFELPEWLAMPNQLEGQQRAASEFLGAVEAHLSQPTGVTHRVSVQYRGLVAHSVQEYLHLARQGNIF